MDEITFQVVRDEETGRMVASWDAAGQLGDITTQGRDLADMQVQVREAVAVHFEDGAAPLRIRMHFVTDATLLPV